MREAVRVLAWILLKVNDPDAARTGSHPLRYLLVHPAVHCDGRARAPEHIATRPGPEGPNPLVNQARLVVPPSGRSPLGQAVVRRCSATARCCLKSGEREEFPLLPRRRPPAPTQPQPTPTQPTPNPHSNPTTPTHPNTQPNPHPTPTPTPDSLLIFLCNHCFYEYP